MPQAQTFKKIAAVTLPLLGLAVAVWVALTIIYDEDAQPAISSAAGEPDPTTTVTETGGTAEEASSVASDEPANISSEDAQGSPPPRPLAASYPVAMSLEELTQKSDIVLIGTVSSVGDISNGIRDPDDPTQPIPEIYGVLQQYHIVVKRYLKGTGPGEITVAQREGTFHSKDWDIYGFDPATWDHSKAAASWVADGYDLMEPGETHLFFLRQSVWNPDSWWPPIEPYRFKRVGDQGVPEGNRREPEIWGVTTMDWEELLTQVEAEVARS